MITSLLRSYFNRLFHSPASRLIKSNSISEASGIHYVAGDGDLTVVKAMLKVNPNLAIRKCYITSMCR